MFTEQNRSLNFNCAVLIFLNFYMNFLYLLFDFF